MYCAKKRKEKLSDQSLSAFSHFALTKATDPKLQITSLLLSVQ